MFGLKRLRTARPNLDQPSVLSFARMKDKPAQSQKDSMHNSKKVAAAAAAVAAGLASSSSFSDADNTAEIMASPSSPSENKDMTEECIICFDDCNTWFTTAHCTHVVCKDCMDPYLISFIDTPKVDYAQIPCPDVKCEHTFDAEHIVGVAAVAPDAWWRTVLERTQMETMGSCPYADCKAVFELDKDSALSSNPKENTPMFGECLECHRGVCIRCEQSWHSGLCKKKPTEWRRPQHASLKNSEEERKHKEKLVELAKKNGWARCPTCKTLVMRETGCYAMTCRCGRKFCYQCGSPRNGNHGTWTSTDCTKECYKLTQTEIDAIRTAMFELDTFV